MQTLNEKLLYRIALTFLDGVGPIVGQALLSYCGSAKNVFEVPKHKLEKIPGVGVILARKIYHSKEKALQRGEQELKFLEKHKSIQTLFISDEKFPHRLTFCTDSPLLLYYSGNCDLNNGRILSIVGTRKITDYGHHIINQFIKNLRGQNCLIVSGLAYGVDEKIHRACVENDIPTIAVLGHGLDRIYPAKNKMLAKKMQENGGLITEFPSETNPDRENFPKRNRIVAGLADATIVVESALPGGSLISAQLAHSYNRDVFAFPGKVGAKFSAGCNHLIKKNIAHLTETVEDVFIELGWHKTTQKPKTIQTNLFKTLTPEDRKLVQLLKEKKISAEKLSVISSLPLSTVTTKLLNLELQGIVRSLPGKLFTLN